MQKIENINITPDKSIFHKIGEANYSIPDAIAELVDNSIDAANYEGVNIDVIIEKKKGEIIIEDNGLGMNKEVMAKALVLAHSTKINSLGEFGLGLKSACTSLGNSFSVTTTTAGSEEQYVLKYDKEEFIKEGGWDSFPVAIDKVRNEEHGTKIIISNLRVKLYDSLVTRLKNELSQRYSPFIAHNNVVIRVGLSFASAKPCIPEMVELDDKGKEEFEYVLKNGSRIYGWWGLRKTASTIQSGFDLFRRGRLIRASERLGYNPHPMTNHIVGEIFMDALPVTHNKREFITESGEFREFVEKFWGDKTGRLVGERIKGKIDDITKVAAERWNKEKVEKQLPDRLKEEIRENILRALNRVDDFKELAFPDLPTEKKRTEKGEEGFMEKRDERVATEEVEKDSEPGKQNDIRTPNKTQPKKSQFITINGRKFKFEFFWKNLDDDTVDKQTVLTEKGVEIFINTGFKGFNICRDSEYYCIHTVAEAIAQVYLEESGASSDRVLELRNKLLYQVASVVLEEDELKKLSKQEKDLEDVISRKRQLLEGGDRLSVTG